MFGRNNYHRCSKCKGNLMPRVNPHTKAWTLTCENRSENKCSDHILENGFQEVFNKLFDWNLNEFDIHDLIKMGKKSYFMLHAIDFIERINIKVYKHRIEALKDYLKLPYGHIFNSLIIRLRYKFPTIYGFIKLSLAGFVILVLAGTYAVLNDDYRNEYLEIAREKIVNASGDYIDQEELDQLIEEEKKEEIVVENLKNIDTDKDGLSDAEEKKLLTDPNNPDTDGDGYSDGDEVKGGYDPLTKA